MMSQNAQSPNCIIMIRPHLFYSNPETAADNKFQNTHQKTSPTLVSKAAYEDVTQAAEILKKYGVRVLLFEDRSDKTPDSCYPNNWFSTHQDGRIVIYPMYVENRRLERRVDIIEKLKSEFDVSTVIDLSELEKDGVFLEGTGSIVIDHIDRIAYAARSKRTDEKAFRNWCGDMDYTPIVFTARDKNGIEIYHTNVMLGIGTDIAVIGSNLISDEDEKKTVLATLTGKNRTGKWREIIELSIDQVSAFAGNILEVTGKDGPLLVLSQTAYDSLSATQLQTIENHLPIVPINVSTIELGGGSIRCMMAGVHLPSLDDEEKCYIRGIN